MSVLYQIHKVWGYVSSMVLGDDLFPSVITKDCRRVSLLSRNTYLCFADNAAFHV